MKPSPRPWKNQEHQHYGKHDGHFITDKHDGYVCSLWHSPAFRGKDTGDATDVNAALIAAAPDLLEACKAVRNIINGRNIHTPIGEMSDFLLSFLDGPIAKAEGGKR
jgi:hypothetical protein